MTTSKAVFAGVTLEAPFARFKAWMAAFNADRMPSRPFGGWEFASMVEGRGNWEETAWCKSGEEEPEPQCTADERLFCYGTQRFDRTLNLSKGGFRLRKAITASLHIVTQVSTNTHYG